MNLLDTIKTLCKNRGISVSHLEEKLNFPKNTIYQWKNRTPGIDKLESVANYFNVSIDYLLGRSDEPYWKLTEKDEKDVGKELEAILTGIETDTDIAFYGEPMDEETRKLVAMAIENNLRMAKEIAKRKYTPKKYRNED